MTGRDIGPVPGLRRPGGRGRAVVIALVAGGLAVVLGANAHLLYSALTSQPGCVPHIKAAGAGPPGSAYRPAQSSC